MYRERLLDFVSSLRLTVACLALLIVLVILGTLYQVEHGIWASQQRFFYAWTFSLFGWLRVPGGLLVMAVLFVNLLAATVRRFTLAWAHAGLILSHAGLLLLLAGGWWTHRFGEEAYLELAEGETANAAASYRDWEFAFWRGNGAAREVTAVDARDLPGEGSLALGGPDLAVRLDTYYPNARAFTGGPDVDNAAGTNASGIVRLEPLRRHTDPEQDLPGAVLDVGAPGHEPARLLLFGADLRPTRVMVGDEAISVLLRRKRYPLPLAVTLVDFQRRYHPNSRIPSSFSSRIRVDLQGVTRETVVRMNHPFRYRDYTFFQASFAALESGEETSVFAVTRNAGRLIPYLSTGLVVLGLTVHFLRALVLRARAERARA